MQRPEGTTHNGTGVATTKLLISRASPYAETEAVQEITNIELQAPGAA
jgi:hypothetical protein